MLWHCLTHALVAIFTFAAMHSHYTARLTQKRSRFKIAPQYAEEVRKKPHQRKRKKEKGRRNTKMVGSCENMESEDGELKIQGANEVELTAYNSIDQLQDGLLSTTQNISPSPIQNISPSTIQANLEPPILIIQEERSSQQFGLAFPIVCNKKVVVKHHEVQIPVRCKPNQLVQEQLQLLRGYFLDELQEIKPYNGSSGEYVLSLQGAVKSVIMSWKYTAAYPFEVVTPTINSSSLNPLQRDQLDQLISDQIAQTAAQQNYFYLFNLSTLIYQELLQSLQVDGSNRNPEPQPTHGKKQKETKEDKLTKKEIYNQFMDEIFYLHDRVEQVEPSMLGNHLQVNTKHKYPGSRGRYSRDFEELEIIGEGGFGKVYRVKHRLDGGIYAIKKIIINYGNPTERKMLKEVSLLSKLNHPNIVRYYQSWLEDVASLEELVEDMSFADEQDKIDELKSIYRVWRDENNDVFFRDDSAAEQLTEQDGGGIMFQEEEDGSGIIFAEEHSAISHRSRKSSKSFEVSSSDEVFPFKILYIAMEFCSGISLRAFIDERFNQEEHKLQIVRGILQGLSYIHSKKIIHRDLKPANIFLTKHNRAKIGDFGLAVMEERTAPEQEFRDFDEKTKNVGTGFYRAPEQFKSPHYDQKIDIYSLGIIMLEMFYDFKSVQGRIETLKEITQTHALPRNFPNAEAMSDIAESIKVCLRENPKERLSAEKLLNRFRSKHFTQLVSAIADPKHFQFYQLLQHLFAMRNESSNIMRRELFREYQVNDILKIYQIHRGNLFVTLPFGPIRDFQTLNGCRIAESRKEKFLLLSEIGVLLEYASNAYSCWVKYAKESIRRRRQRDQDEEEQEVDPEFRRFQAHQFCEQLEELRRFTFEKVAVFQGEKGKDQYSFKEKFVTAFDIAYTYEQGFNPYLLCEMLKICQAMALTLPLTQKRPPILLGHSKLFVVLAKLHRTSVQALYSCLLATNQEKFSSMLLPARLAHFQQFNIDVALSRKICRLLDISFDSSQEFIRQLDLKDCQQTELIQIQSQIDAIRKVQGRFLKNPIKWRIQVPQNHTNGIYWSVGPIKGFTSLEEYMTGVQFCNLHLEMDISQGVSEADVSIWSIGEYLQEDILELVRLCWSNGVSAKWFGGKVNEKEMGSRSRHSIVLKKKQDRVFMMVKSRELREEKFKNRDQFNEEVLKGMSTFSVHNYYH